MRELNLEPIQSVERAIHILNCFSYEKSELTIEEIMSKTKLAKTTTYRLLWTLERNYLVQYNQTTNRYRLGTGLLEYSGVVLENLDIRREADPYLVKLHEDTGHSVILAQPQSDTIQYLVRYDSEDGLQPNNFVGRRRVLHNGAFGIVLLAHMETSFVEQLLKEYPLESRTPKTLTDKTKFIERLGEIRAKGYFVDVDETFIGYTAISAPIFNDRNQVIAAVGISGPSYKIEGDRREELIFTIKSVASTISLKMGQIKSNTI
ncbi:IclR family transcriptional regulator [Halalkalibacter alkaliphilus]|uniref:IclR family transcriptional regulator n=1 Tax=Halalkalibacter alkaliphilus TaxID=2917993 RepID=A0A9X2CUV6_9BACI|nr:IclR family transcriptional regulator [Halalkalibacter alkaliphilus]MCL7748334.1 IclR family transcriptional regulator [Halalkalibacter alkaliphilus]